MKVVRQNQMVGTKSELVGIGDPGSTFVTTDTNEIFIYNGAGFPKIANQYTSVEYLSVLNQAGVNAPSESIIYNEINTNIEVNSIVRLSIGVYRFTLKHEGQLLSVNLGNSFNYNGETTPTGTLMFVSEALANGLYFDTYEIRTKMDGVSSDNVLYNTSLSIKKYQSNI